MATIAGRKADIYVTSGAPIALVNEPMSDITATYLGPPSPVLARTTYGVTNLVKRYFDPAAAMVFQRSLDSGVTWNAVVPDNVAAGLISFVAQQQLSPLAMFRVLSGNYLPYSRMGGGHEWGLTPNQDIIEVTEFPMTSKRHIVAQAGGTVALKRWWIDDTMRAVLGNLIVVVLYVDQTAQPAAPRYEALVRLSADAIKTAAKGAIEEDLTFEIQSDVTFLAA